ncbi:uncharacterized protein [Periplaneta americana]|uniref:uncharacterized protein isoform X2 n=1 Tax=Periplaneta americana TaxID=6978 RepID=UPI0037E97D6F
MEPEDDPHDKAHKIEENRASSQAQHLSHLEVSSMKPECVDESYFIKSEIKVEDTTPLPFTFHAVKSEVDEDFLDEDAVHQAQLEDLSSEENEALTDR